MSKARGASRMRKIIRAGISKVNMFTGELEGRPFNNSKNAKRKPTHVFVKPTMVVERNGKDVSVDKTETISYERRVFPDKDGNYPDGAELKNTSLIGNKSPYYFIMDTKEINFPTHREKLKSKKS
jgi:hypothetical protein